MDTLTAHAESVGYPLKGPTFLSQPGDGRVLSRIDLRVRMGMFEEESTPVFPAIFSLTGSQNDVEHPALLGPLARLSQFVERAVWAIEPSDLL